MDKGFNSINRREFIKGAAAAGTFAAVAGMGFTISMAAEDKPKSPVKWDETYDLVVIGSGITAQAAACEAAANGSTVVMLEKEKGLGGCTIVNSGLFDLHGGTRIQKKMGIEDSPEIMYGRYANYNLASNRKDNRDLLKRYCDMSPAMLEWMEDKGVKFKEDGLTYTYSAFTSSAPRCYHQAIAQGEKLGLSMTFTSPKGEKYTTSGTGFIRPMNDYVLKHGGKLYLEHNMTDILVDDKGAVTGVKVETPKGVKYFKADKGVVLGSGSWKANTFLRMIFDGRLTDDLITSGEPYVKADGSAIIAALKIGAILGSDRGTSVSLFRKRYGSTYLCTEEGSKLATPGHSIAGTAIGSMIYVNSDGKRFASEQETAQDKSYEIYDALLAQKDHIVWAIFDDTAVKKYKWQMTPPMVEKDMAFTADSLARLAKMIKVPVAALEGSVAQYNACVDAGEDKEFLRPSSMLKVKLTTGPFYALKVNVILHDTCGGVVIDKNAQVIGIEGKPIPKLYAGGEAAAGLTFIGTPRGAILGRIAAMSALNIG